VVRKLFDFFIFSSLYISSCACLMVYQASWLLLHQAPSNDLLAFVFLSTACSYNFHWFLTDRSISYSRRIDWTQNHKTLTFGFYLLGQIGSAWFFFRMRAHWLELSVAVFFTFLYSAPKLQMFRALRQIAVGKTVFLTIVWAYVTSVLPVLIEGAHWQTTFSLFALSRFFLIYSICILFDCRDREDDRSIGIRSMITYLSERGIRWLFAGSILACLASTLALAWFNISLGLCLILLLPALITAGLYRYARLHFSDYFYYVVLDGLMMLSSLLMLFSQFAYF
jgi:4-hydroxybenzoate polyprenyltransferase